MPFVALVLGIVLTRWSTFWLLQGELVPEASRVFWAPRSPSVEALPAPEATDTTLRWLVLGDWGTGGQIQRRVARAMAEVARRAPVHWILSTGDNFYPSGVRSADDPRWESHFERVYAESSLRVPWYPVLGNHDYRGHPDAQVAYSQRNRLWRMPARYYTHEHTLPDGTPVLFVALDTQELLTGPDTARRRQLQWLERTLRRFSRGWKFAVGHHPLRSAGAYGENAQLLRLLKPLFDRYGVAAYFCGHEHDLQLLRHPDDRFVCVISGAGGGVRSTSYGPFTLFAAAQPGFVYAALGPQTLRLWFIAADGSILAVETVPRPEPHP